jgi:uncharacterized protein (DUF885 family)
MTGDVLTSFFSDLLNINPSFGSFLGYRNYDYTIENWASQEYRERWKKLTAKYKKLLKNVKDDQAELHIQSFKWFIDVDSKFEKSDLWMMPLMSFENQVISMVFASRVFYPLKTETDHRNLIHRYECMTKILPDLIVCLKEGIKHKMVIPKLICKHIIEDLLAFQKEKSYIIKIKTHDAGLTQRYTKCISLYEEQLSHLIHFLQTDYINKCRADLGLCGLPNGKQLYKDIVQAETTSDMIPEDIFRYGLAEVKRIKNEFMKLRELLGYKHLNYQQFCDAVKNNPSNYASSIPTLLRHYENVRKRIQQTVVNKYFHKDIVKPYLVQPVPKDIESSSVAAFYFPGNYDKKSNGVFMINTRNLRESPLFSTFVLSLHEGSPGHHFQFQRMIEDKIPIERVFSFNCNGFVEGYALYVESLGKYSNLEYFGKLTYEMLRALRLVVDVGIHYYGWSWKKAHTYMIQNLPMEDSEITSELLRYVCIPGQALCYKVGEKVILELRQQYLKHGLGSIKDFHEEILKHGVLPLEILKRHIHNLIANKTK